MGHDAEIRVRTKVDTREFGKMDKAMDKAKTTLAKMGSIAKSTGASILNMLKGLGSGLLNFVSSFTKGLLKGTLMAGLVVGFRELFKLLKEGLQDFAQYSTEYNTAMSDFKSSLATLKGALATAFAPIMEIILPYLTQFIDWLTRACESVAMFFAILQGKSTFTRATKQAVNYASGLKKVNKELKQLASFDELNVLNSSSGSGGGAGGGASLWEEAPIDTDRFKWLEWVKEHLELIKELAELIGIALLSWKISELLGARFGVVFGILELIAGSIQFIKASIDAIKNGLNFNNINSQLKGSLKIIGGLATALGTLVGFWGIIAGVLIGGTVTGLTEIVIAIRQIRQDGEITGETAYEIFNGLMTSGNFVLAQLFAFEEILRLLPNLIKLIGEKIRNADGDINKISTDSNNWFDRFVSGCAKIVIKIGEFIGKVQSIGTAIKNAFTTSPLSSFASAIQSLISSVAGIISSLGSAIQNVWNYANNMVSGVRQSVSEVVDALSKITGININVPTVTTKKAPKSSVKMVKMATGGVVESPTRALIGEAGREAVLPLENNTGWMDILADKVSQNINVSFDVNADADRIFKVVKKKATVYTKATGLRAF